LSTVGFRSIDRNKIRKVVLDYADRLRKAHPEIERVIWFGSWVTGLPTPRSDVDICLVLTSSDKSPRDRIPDYLPLGFPTGIDLFAYTSEEFERLQTSSPGWYETITSGEEI
jgi:uncharacterized protein